MDDPLEIEEQLFSAALGRPAEQRAAFLAEIARDQPDVAARIAALLRSHLDAALLRPGDGLQAGGGPEPRGQIGRYTLREKLGEGGVGLVFRAEQCDPFRREVALKVIKPGMDTAEVIARFESERQALALMDHPNIARVFDAGATPEGRPFFAMELVSGPPITRLADEQRLSLEARLGLFLKVCHALHHAHGKGIVHRDVKPSNILVATHDGDYLPKVIDFGIAKATELKLTAKTLVTLFPRFMGTPSAMSPEQAAENGGDIDARSDVYSLGVLLCELVTSRTPLGPLGANFRYEEIRRRICEDPAPALGELLRQLDPPALALVAQFRRTDVGRLQRVAEGKLSWIARRCLAKQRAERYPTARALAEDVQRYPRHEPIEARPPPPLADWRARLRGHGAMRWAGAAMAAAVEGFARRARSVEPAAAPAPVAPAEARTINVEAHRLVLEGRKHWNEFTEEGFVRAEAAFTDALRISPGLALAQAGLAYVSGRRAILATVASRHIESLLAATEGQARAALAADPNIGEAHSVLGAMALLRGRHAEAIRHLEQALHVNGNSELAWAYLSRVHMCQGRPDLAIPELENARLLIPIPAGFALHRGYAFMLARRHREALALLEDAEQKGAASPNTRAQAAFALTALQRTEEAVAQARTALSPAAKTSWTSGMNAMSDGMVAWTFARCGARGEAQALVAGIFQLPSRHHFAAGFAVALLGDRRRGLELLSDTPEWIRDVILLFERETGCFGDDVEFQRLLHQLNLAAAWRAVQGVVDGPLAATEGAAQKNS